MAPVTATTARLHRLLSHETLSREAVVDRRHLESIDVSHVSANGQLANCRSLCIGRVCQPRNYHDTVIDDAPCFIELIARYRSLESVVNEPVTVSGRNCARPKRNVNRLLK
jgi:hypothetical protein